jgi:glucose/arabinose dehydrogenase
LRVPEGFRANLFADKLSHARWLAVAPNGDVFLAEPGLGIITLLRDPDGSGHASVRATFAAGFEEPHGIAFRPGYIYIADTRAVWRIPYTEGDETAHGSPERVTPPGALGDGGGHWTRNIAFAPDGQHFYVSIGSSSNVAEDLEPRATVRVFNLDGSGGRTFASGLRNPIGIAFQPGTNDLFAVVNERDGLGDGLVPDYLTHLQDGGFYGWPYSYLGQHPQPRLADRRPDLVKRAIVPDLLFRSHSAPLGLAFYTGTQFPQEYRGDAFVALHGSWNSATPTGYMVVRVPFRDGRSAGYSETFASGFWIAGDTRAEVWGRPVGLAIAKDGSLLIADDVGNTVWRVSYTGK